NRKIQRLMQINRWATVVFKLGVGLVLLVCALSILGVGVFWYMNRHSSQNRKKLIESAQSIRAFNTQTFNASVRVGTKLENDETVSYSLFFQCNEGFLLDNRLATRLGTVTVEFLDADGFSVHKEDVSDFSRICSGGGENTFCSGLEAR